MRPFLRPWMPAIVELHNCCLTRCQSLLLPPWLPLCCPHIQLVAIKACLSAAASAPLVPFPPPSIGEALDFAMCRRKNRGGLHHHATVLASCPATMETAILYACACFPVDLLALGWVERTNDNYTCILGHPQLSSTSSLVLVVAICPSLTSHSRSSGFCCTTHAYTNRSLSITQQWN